MAEPDSRHNRQCRSEFHNRYLCYMVSQGFHLSDDRQYKTLVSSPRFKCEHCGRVANSDENLCEPVEM